MVFRYCRCALAFLALVFAVDVLALDWREPEPFRRDRLAGRSFDYNAESFLHRFSFEPKPALDGRRRLQGSGLEGVGGSTRSRELYVRMDGRLELPLDGPAFAGYRFRRDEDFDGRFDQNLIGGGVRLDGWQLGVWGDVVGAKEELDLHGDIRWADGSGNAVRASLVAVDAIFNGKQREGTYQRYPYTLYLSGRWQASEAVALYGFTNLNTPMRLDDLSTRLRSDDEQYSAGIGLAVALTESVDAGLELEGLRGRRERRGMDEPLAEEQRLRRDYAAITAEVRHSPHAGEQRWLGVRHLFFDENDRRPSEPSAALRQERRETTLYLGRRWSFNERVGFAPVVYLAHLDVRETGSDDDTDRETGFYGKFSPAIELLVNQRTGGLIVLNPTIRLHEAAFGGGNVQVYLPF